jgi:hypothetical protein
VFRKETPSLLFGGSMKKLSDRIWETRKCRINYEKRLLNYMRFMELVIPFYSIFLIALSIISLSSNNRIINFSSIIGSISILIISIIGSNKDYKGKAKEIKNQYISLEKLLFDSNKAEDRNDNEKILQIEKEYIEILRNTDNHSEFDFLKLKNECLSLKRENKALEFTVPIPSFFEKCKYRLIQFGTLLIISIIFILPIIIVIFEFL